MAQKINAVANAIGRNYRNSKCRKTIWEKRENYLLENEFWQKQAYVETYKMDKTGKVKKQYCRIYTW